MPACPSCGEQNSEQARFCQACGTSLAAPSRSAVEERRIVTALFCDLVGFTAGSDRADPEDVMGRLRPFYASVRAAIEAFGGTVQKFIGDAVVGAFGARVAHEDDPERAVRAALRILESIDDLNEEQPGLGLTVRIGVNTGEVLVPAGPTSEDNEILAIGDAVNVASRLQSVAAAGTVAVGASTYEATRLVFVYEALEPVAVKGKAEPLSVWRAVEPLARVGADVTRSHEGPFVGRRSELDLLRTVFARASTYAAPQLVTIVGEAGAGKSRLVGELLRDIEALPEPVVWRQGRCLPYGDGITFWALADIVKAHLGIRDTDPPATAEAKLDAGLSGPEGERDWMKARLGALLGLDLGASADREELFTAWARFLESTCEASPAVLVVEDLHWADDAMVEFVEYLMQRLAGVPMLLLGTARPELLDRHPRWPGGARDAATLSLRPLTDEETAQLVEEVIGHAVPAGVPAGIVERAGGNPLYAKEYARLLQDRRDTDLAAGSGPPDVPPTVQAIIAARLDTLAPTHRAILQSAAVIGKVFWSSAVVALDGLDEAAVDAGLLELSKRELVHRTRDTSMEGQHEFAFWHALIPEVAYQQLPRLVRADRHAALVRWLDEHAGGGSLDLAGVIAHHAVQALDLSVASGRTSGLDDLRATARRWLTLAGDRALALDVEQAVRFYSRALALSPEGDGERGALLVRVADAERQAGRYEESAAAFKKGVETLRAQGDRRAAGRAAALHANVLRHMNVAGAEAILAEGTAALEQEPPGPELVEAYAETAGHEYVLGDFPRSVEWADKAIDLAGRIGVDPGMRALGFRGASRCLLGDRGGLDDLRQALSLGLRAGAGRDTALVYANLAGVSWLVEGPAASWAVYEKGVAFARRRGIAEFALITEAASLEALFDLGRWDELLALADRLDEPLAATGAVLDLLWMRTVKGHVLAERRRFAEADAIVAEIGDEVRADGGAQLMVPTFTIDAMCRAEEGRMDGAGARVVELIELPAIGQDPNCLPFLRTLAELAVATGRRDAAERMAAGIPATTARHQAVGASVGAVAAEAGRDAAEAAVRYLGAAERWRGLGVVLEEGAALVGAARTLAASGEPQRASMTAARASELLRSLGIPAGQAGAAEASVAGSGMRATDGA
jgi:class 3 adenylate cyclase/tetratricopeptide (TPR) repeat protein